MSPGAKVLVSLLVVLLTALAYRGSLTDEYVYDDVRFVAKNPAVTRGAPLFDYFADPSTQTGDGSHEGLWRPLRTLSFRVVHAASDGARAQRLVNLALHLGNGLLVWLLLRRVVPGARGVGAILGAAAFLLHPAATEPVAWISGRGDLLATTAILGTVLLWLRGGTLGTSLAVVVFGLGLLAKESAVAVLLVLPALELLRDGVGGLRRRLPALGALAAVALVWAAVRYRILGDEFAQGAGRALGAGGLAVTSFTEILYYLRVLLLPAGLSFELRLPPSSTAPILAILGFLATLLLVWAARRFRGRARPFTIAVLWFLAVLLPVTFLQVLFPLKSLVANRFAYPALFAGSVLVAWVAARGPRFALLSTLVLVAFLPLTAGRADAFGSGRKLWDDVLRQDPGNVAALQGAGFLAAQGGEWRRAESLLRRAAAEDLLHPGVAALHGEALEHLAREWPEGSARQTRYLEAALDSYHLAVRTWQAGHPDERRLYRLTLANAAWLALVLERPDLAIGHVTALVGSDEPVPPPGPARTLLVRRLAAIRLEFERAKLMELARGLADLEAVLDGRGEAE